MKARVLVIGDMRRGTNSLSVARAFSEVSGEVALVDTSPVAGAAIGSPNWRIGSANWRSIRSSGQVAPKEQARIAKDVRQKVRDFRPDLIFCIKTIYYDQGIFLDQPVPLKVHFSFDDVSNVQNTSRAYLDHESGWDCVITTKRHNVQELYARGVHDVLQIWGAYDPVERYCTTPYGARKYEVGFIGVERPDRRKLPVDMALNAPHRGVVYGPKWRRKYPFGVRGVDLPGEASGADHVSAANNIKIGLLLLNSDNRDTHTNRTFEMPATGQMVLGQRTDEHQRLFNEGEEAVFFSDEQEMWQLYKDYSLRPETALRIAEAGYNRIVNGDNTYAHRAREILKHLELS